MLQLTLFTLGHSLTLALSIYGYVNAPTMLVEVAIALSIVFVAVENLLSEQVSAWRPYVVLASGLIHGLGFAHVFEQVEVAREDFLPALFSYNLGIEAGQIAIVGIAWLLVSFWWKRPDYRRHIARPASALIALSGIYWVVARIV